MSVVKNFIVLAILVLSAFSGRDGFGWKIMANDKVLLAKTFTNPAKLNQTMKCAPENIDSARFSNNFPAKGRVKVCEGMDLFISHSELAANNAAAPLNRQMHLIWQTFLETRTRFLPLPKNKENSIFAASAAYPNNNVYQAAVYISPEKADSELFFYIFWHELKHVYDIKEVWEKRGRISNYDLEFNGFYFASELAEVYRPKEWEKHSGFWRDEWKNLPAAQKHQLRTQAIDDFMNKSPIYADTRDRTQAQYDFTNQ